MTKANQNKKTFRHTVRNAISGLFIKKNRTLSTQEKRDKFSRVITKDMSKLFIKLGER